MYCVITIWVIRCIVVRYWTRDFRNSLLYNFQGKINTKKVSISGINEIKYPTRNKHASSIDFIHFDTNVMIKCGNERITNTIGAVNKCLCCRNCSLRMSLLESWIESGW